MLIQPLFLKVESVKPTGHMDASGMLHYNAGILSNVPLEPAELARILRHGAAAFNRHRQHSAPFAAEDLPEEA